MDESFVARGQLYPVPFRVTDKALYLPIKKRFAVMSPWYFRRVPLSGIRDVGLQKSGSRASWIAALGVVGAGLVLWPLGVSSPLGFLFVAVMIILASRGRMQLVVALSHETYRWQPVATWPGGKQAALNFLNKLLDACRTVGLPVTPTQPAA